MTMSAEREQIIKELFERTQRFRIFYEQISRVSHLKCCKRRNFVQSNLRKNKKIQNYHGLKKLSRDISQKIIAPCKVLI